MNYLKPIIKHGYKKYPIPLTNYCIIMWNKQSKSHIHNHNGNECYFITLNNGLKEIIYKNKDIDSKKIKQIDKKQLKQFVVNHINDNIGYHQILNESNKTIWSIHKYFKY